MVELILIKRRAREGEIGLFCDAQPFEDDWSSLPIGQEVKAECTVPANLKYLRFFWALAGKVADNCDWLIDKDDAAEQILLEARHCKVVYDPRKDKAEVKRKSVAGLSADTWIRLLRRCTHVVIIKFLPGMEENVLKAEIEAMIGMDVFAPASVKKREGGEQVKPSGPPHETDSPTVDRSGPTTLDEYVAACRKWIPQQADLKCAMDYFDGDFHKELRKRLNVTQGHYRMLHREILMFFNEKEKA